MASAQAPTGAADGLGDLAGEGEDRVGRTLGALAGLPLAVLDGVGLEAEHHGVDQRGADALDGQEDQGEGQRAGRDEEQGDAADDGEQAAPLEDVLLADLADDPAG